MDPERLTLHRLHNLTQTLLLLAGMAVLLGALGWVIAGGAGVIWTLAVGLIALSFTPRISPWMVLRLYGARELDPHAARGLYQLLGELAQRAGLGSTPRLFYLPTRVVNAFSVGSREQAAVVVSDGLLRNLPPRELTAVLAHEVSHIGHNDMRVMTLADLVSRLTGLLSLSGQILLLINLPLLLFGMETVSWRAVLLLIAAPSISALLQLALSRSREYEADMGAAELTGDPEGLASALQRLEYVSQGWFERVFLPGRRVPEPSLLRTHPPTEERVRRLLSLVTRRPRMAGPPAYDPWLDALPRIEVPPRWRIGGRWY